MNYYLLVFLGTFTVIHSDTTTLLSTGETSVSSTDANNKIEIQNSNIDRSYHGHDVHLEQYHGHGHDSHLEHHHVHSHLKHYHGPYIHRGIPALHYGPPAHHHPSPLFKGLWKKKFSWAPRWVKTWQPKKVYVAVWKRMWSPVYVNEWLPVPRPPPGWITPKVAKVVITTSHH